MKLRNAFAALAISAFMATSFAQSDTVPPPFKESPSIDSSKRRSRPVESIKLVLEANKEKIYSAYGNSVRVNPSAQGMMTIQIRIAPSGKVKSCEVVKAKWVSVELVDAVLAIIKTFDFGEMDVEPMIVTYPVEFHPR
jgi:protein TonB